MYCYTNKNYVFNTQHRQVLTDKNSKDRLVVGLQSQLDSLKGHLQEANGVKSAYEQEIQRLKGDLNTMTQENQVSHLCCLVCYIRVFILRQCMRNFVLLLKTGKSLDKNCKNISKQ